MKLKNLQWPAALFVSLVVAGAAHAQSSGTWVSGVGDDVNPCSRTAPCKTFAGAIAKTASGGTVRVLDPGGFGQFTITKAITIEGLPGATHILQLAGPGIVVQAGAGDLVVLRNLNFEGVNPSTATYGVRVVGAGEVVMENVSLQHQGAAVNIDAGAGAVRVQLHNVNVSASGVGVRNQAPLASVAFQGGVLRGNGAGIAADAGDVLLSGASLLHNTTAFSQLNGTVWSTGDNVFFGNANGDNHRMRRAQSN